MSLLGALQDKQFWRDVGSNANDLGQAASNSVASNVTAPVDGIAWLLRKAGVNMPTPVGGSDWAKNAGLLREVPESPAGVAGDTLGMIAPMLMMAKAPEIARGLLQGADNMMANRTMGKQAGKVFVYPQDEALATAQRNAALPVERGGLGLPEGNTPMDRAKAMGFDTEGVHTSRHGIDTNVLDSGKYAMAPFDAIGTHFGTKEAALDRFNRTVGTTEQFKGSTYPVLLDGSRPLMNKQGAIFNEEPLLMSLSEKADYGNLPVSNAAQREQIFSKNSIIPYINDVEGPGSISYIAPPKNIRSRFAAFDPMRRNEADLLGQADPALLALIAAGGYGSYKAMEP
jgi:hypothetical protein